MATEQWLGAGLLTLLILAAQCGCEHSTSPKPDHAPVISSLTAVPDSMSPSDSTVVTCVAADPDSDPLVFDWFTDTRLRIKGAPGGVYLYNSGPTQLFLYGTPLTPDSIAWISCTVRDQRGMHATSIIWIRYQS